MQAQYNKHYIASAVDLHPMACAGYIHTAKS